MCVQLDDAADTDASGTTEASGAQSDGTEEATDGVLETTTTGHQDSTDADAETSADATGAESTGEPPPSTNFVFVTSVAKAPGTLGGLEAADALCNELAEQAALPGTYVAWLSTEEVDARDRLGDARGWIRVDGLPFVDTLDDLIAREILYPVRIDETGVDALSARAATGTQADGTYLADRGCEGWASTEGVTEGGRVDWWSWTTNFQFPCGDESARIYCFGIDHQTPVEIEPTSQRYAFLSSAGVPGHIGLAGFDEHCATEARAARLPGSYKALVATPDESPSARFELSGEPWSLVNGVLITDDPADLAEGDLLSPIWRDATGARQTGNPWTGASSPTSPAAFSCDDWDDVEASGGFSSMMPSIDFMATLLTGSCSISRKLWCLRE